MFGNAPKALWSRWIEPDAHNRIPLACRCLLVRDGDRLILLEAGIGVFFAPNLRERYGVNETEHLLLSSLAALGIAPEQIDVVVFSHLHFDHAGGALTAWRDDGALALVFPRARFVVGAVGGSRSSMARAATPWAPAFGFIAAGATPQGSCSPRSRCQPARCCLPPI
jgi:glyoxylase-like metal-dependent hydrolase (beta-lactamase superfamily II)